VHSSPRSAAAIGAVLLGLGAIDLVVVVDARRPARLVGISSTSIL
jgi:hypothetical protein